MNASTDQNPNLMHAEVLALGALLHTGIHRRDNATLLRAEDPELNAYGDGLLQAALLASADEGVAGHA